MLRTTMTPDEAFILQTIEDDDEEAPWMSMGDLQAWATSNLFIVLRHYGRIHHPEWYVAHMLPILFPRPGRVDKGKLSPDLFMALAEDYPRQSYDLTVETNPPGFVLEVLSPESVGRDVEVKPRAYSGLGVDEYVLFAPTRELGQPSLQGYRRDVVTEHFVQLAVDVDGTGWPRLWSETLGLWIVARGREVRAQDAAGQWLLTYEESMIEREREAREREREARARLQAEAEREREARAREALEEEVRRLRAELDRRDRC